MREATLGFGLMSSPTGTQTQKRLETVCPMEYYTQSDMTHEEKLRSIKDHLKRRTCASGAELARKLSLSPRRLSDYLRSLGCLTSYSHRRSFYVLPETAAFNAHRIWRCRRTGALFTDLHSLSALVEWHVKRSPAGLTCRKLSAVTEVRAEPHILRISRERGLVRQKFDGEYVYFYRRNEKVYLGQVAQRKRDSSTPGPQLETNIDSDVVSLQRDLQIAVALLNHPEESPESIVTILRETGHPATPQEFAEFLDRYGIKKKDDRLPVVLIELVGAAAKLQAALRARGISLANCCIILEPPIECCPRCGGSLHVLKTTEPRRIVSIRFGTFWIKETIKACPSCGDQRTWHPRVPQLLAPPKCSFSYDLIVFAGEQKFLVSRTLREIRQTLIEDYKVRVSRSMLSLYVQEFCCRFECLHYAKIAKLGRWIKKEQLGYMLHVDCSSEHKSDTVFVCYDRTSEIALVSEKIPSERLPFLVPTLKKVRKHLGQPVSTMSDLGIAILKALEEVFPNAERRICHFHFLRDVGKDILGPSYDELRSRLNGSKVNADLNVIERDILSTNSTLEASVESLIKEEGPLLRRCTREQYTELEPVLALYFVRACRKVRSSTGFGYPFDLPWLRYAEELRDQAIKVQACFHVLRQRRITPVLLKRVGDVLSPMLPGGELSAELEPLVHRCLLRERQFAELRKAMRLWRTPNDRAPLSSTYGVTSRRDIVEFNEDLRRYRHKLRQRVSPTGESFRKDGYQVILSHVEKYWGSLVLHPSLWRALKCQIVDRTNNLVESVHRDSKQSLRKTCGRQRIDREFSDYGPYLPVISNLRNAKYVELVLGEHDNLALEFAQLDEADVAYYRQKFLEARHGPMYRAVRAISGAQIL